MIDFLFFYFVMILLSICVICGHAVTHLLNCSLSSDCDNETIVFVTEVPMLVPIMIGIAVFTSRTVN